ncbi:AAA family ATPase [Curtobacterium aurantiacum]|nr:AAA family ATPase [Curtobacterium flaccumfaciens]
MDGGSIPPISTIRRTTNRCHAAPPERPGTVPWTVPGRSLCSELHSSRCCRHRWAGTCGAVRRRRRTALGAVGHATRLAQDERVRMWISRLRVTGGFLNGVDVDFTRGLNVVVGPRGVGKTTLLELIRHGLGARHADRDLERQRRTLISSVLGDGEVVIDLEDEKSARQLVVDSKGRGVEAAYSDRVLVLGQSELEGIASDAQNRLSLLDLRAGVVDHEIDYSEVREITRQLATVRSELRRRLELSEKRTTLVADLELLSAQEASLIGDAEGPVAASRNRLKVVETQAANNARQVSNLGDVRDAADEAKDGLQRSYSAVSRVIDRFPHVLVEQASLREGFVQSQALIAAANQAMIESIQAATDVLESARSEGNRLADIAGPLRSELEASEAGLGEITAQIRNVKAQLLELEENDVRVNILRKEGALLASRRAEAFAFIEEIEEQRFVRRQRVAVDTTAQVTNNIAVEVKHFADVSSLKTVLANRLRGTHTRATVIEDLSSRILPRTLLEIVEGEDIAGLASVGDLTSDQATRVYAAFEGEEALVELASIRLKDSVDFILRDGRIDKSVDSLSTGQKCAVTLPIVLSERDRALILDQPEDHLDNAYLVDHVVTGLIKRSVDGTQTIVATHNANIPVLGSAERVLVMSSDGARGEVARIGAFDAPDVVKSITKLMEGGKDAFERRHDFYRDHGGLNDGTA